MATPAASQENELRQRKGASNKRTSTTDLPWKSPSGHLILEDTPIPKQRKRPSYDNLVDSERNLLGRPILTDSDTTQDLTDSASKGGPRKAMSGDAVKKDERRGTKVFVRLVSGLAMIGVFVGCVFMGHIYVCGLVAVVEVLLFRELVKVRYNVFFHAIQDTIPLFRTTQWLWFATAILYSYGDFVAEIITSNQDLHHFLQYAQYWTSVSFLFYSGTFVMTISTMQVGHIKFQLNQLSWTIVVLCLTVGQLKYIMHNIYNGLYWFAMPILLVVTNDVMAYAAGMCFGRKFIRDTPFIAFSPNKTWEGFFGGALCTLVASWHLSRFLAQYKWMACPTNEFSLAPDSLDCELDPIFQEAQSIFPPQLFELFPSVVVKIIPGIVEKCAVAGTDVVTACVSGESTHGHDHFELILKNVYPVQIHTLALAMFASTVAPFGGFLASAIKRAYGIKDFDSIIPGHGGLMDRFDCQLLMALCTWVYYNTFIKMATVSVSKMIYMYNLLSPQEKAEFMETIKQVRRRKVGAYLDY